MAGHSKWANIKHRKARVDAKKGKLFTKLLKEITIAARSNPNPAENPRLRAAVQKAQIANMSKDTIDKAIKKNELKGQAQLEEITYEGYGPHSIAILVETATDNKQRTVGEVRHIFTKWGGTLGQTGSVGFLFQQRGQIFLEDTPLDDALIEIITHWGGEDFEELENGLVVATEPKSVHLLAEKLQVQNYAVSEVSVEYCAQSEVELDAEQQASIVKMLEAFEDLEDVQSVYSNMNYEL